MKTKSNMTYNREIKIICIAVDEVGTAYGHWLSEMPTSIRKKYEYLVVNSMSEATEMKEKLEKQGKKVFINYLSV